MLTENQKLWIAALRSGKYKQGKEWLNSGNKFCCLGVAAELFKTETTIIKYGDVTAYAGGNTAVAPYYVIEALNLHDAKGTIEPRDTSLTIMNDRGMSFKKIADFIEKNYDVVFKQKEVVS